MSPFFFIKEIRLANTINTYEGDGSTNSWTVGFNYLNKSHVFLFIDGVEDETYTWITDSTIAATVIPADGAVITVQRVTPRNALVTSIAVSGTLRGNDVNRIGLQALYVAEEGYDALTAVLSEDLADGKWDAQSKVIKDLGAPTNPNDAARYVDVTTIAGSAAAAAASASAASASSSAASAAKTAAELAETNAETAETNAETAQAAAEAARDAAQTAETNAETAETNAEAARDLALSYRDTASTHATTATTQAGIATTQAGIATTQAGLAATAKTAAEAAETAAEAARDAALAAQTAAEAALDSFDDKYLGSKASAPTLDNDGNALVEGQLYWNSVSNELFIYTGGAWSATGGGGGASVTVSDTAPVAPAAGDLWYDSTDGTLNVFYSDGTSDQWVDVAGATLPSSVYQAGGTDVAVADGGTGASTIAGAKTNLEIRDLTLGTSQTTTSGTSKEYTSIPSWVNRIKFHVVGVTTNGASRLVLQVGTSGGYVTTGYNGAGFAHNIGAPSTMTAGGATDGCMIYAGAAVDIRSGTFILERFSGNEWQMSYQGRLRNADIWHHSEAYISLAGALDRVRLIAQNGTDAFDAGAVNIMYE